MARVQSPRRDSSKKEGKSACGGARIPSARRRESKKPQGRRLMRLHIVRGRFFTTLAAHEEECPLDEAVWSKMREDLIWEVLRFVPAAKHFQLQLVSRKWRQVLTSAGFRSALMMRTASASVSPRVEAVVTGSLVRAGLGDDEAYNNRSSSSSSGKNLKAKVVDIDLASFVPSWFWTSKPGYRVVAAADGLVCISNDDSSDKKRRRDDDDDSSDYCVLNPLTRTCTMLPKLPFRPDRWLQLTTSAVTIARHHLETYKVATCDLPATSGGSGGGRVVVGRVDAAQWRQPQVPLVLGDPLALCGGKVYGSRDQTYYRYGESWVTDQLGVVAPEDAAAVLDAPPVASLRRDARHRRRLAMGRTMFGYEMCEYGVDLVAHRGALFYVAQLMWWHGELEARSRCRRPPVACAVWRLAGAGDGDGVGERKEEEKEKWVMVARLEVGEVERLVAGSRQAPGGRRSGFSTRQLNFFTDDLRRFHAYGMRELLCCSLVRVEYYDDAQVDDGSRPRRRFLVVLGFNLDTGEWELVHEVELERTAFRPVMSAPVELRPDLFLS